MRTKGFAKLERNTLKAYLNRGQLGTYAYLLMIADAQYKVSVTTREAAKYLKIGISTFRRDVDDLEKRGLLVSLPNSRCSEYLLTSPIAFEQPSDPDTDQSDPPQDQESKKTDPPQDRCDPDTDQSDPPQDQSDPPQDQGTPSKLLLEQITEPLRIEEYKTIKKQNPKPSFLISLVKKTWKLIAKKWGYSAATGGKATDNGARRYFKTIKDEYKAIEALRVLWEKGLASFHKGKAADTMGLRWYFRVRDSKQNDVDRFQAILDGEIVNNQKKGLAVKAMQDYVCLKCGYPQSRCECE
jgi:hypothetical protein